MDDATKLRKAEGLLDMLREQDAAVEARNRAVAAAEALHRDAGLDALREAVAAVTATAQRCQALAALIESRRRELGIGQPADDGAMFDARQEILGAAIQALEQAAQVGT